MSGRIIPVIWWKGWGFPGIRPLSTFLAYYVQASKLRWHLWVCPLTDVLQWVHNEAQGLLEGRSLAILDKMDSNQFLLYPQGLCHSFNGCDLPFPLVSLCVWFLMNHLKINCNHHVNPPLSTSAWYLLRKRTYSYIALKKRTIDAISRMQKQTPTLILISNRPGIL